MNDRGKGLMGRIRFTKTNMSYGVNEVLLASVLGSVVFAIFAAQPLVIVGVTGPITVFN
jgi:boron transporter